MERGIRILLVEDNEADTAVTKRLLKLNQRIDDLILAMNGQEAMEALQRMYLEGNLPESYSVGLKSARRQRNRPSHLR